MRILSGCTFLLLISTTPACAGETPAELAAKLGSPSFAERERASAALEKLGKHALPALFTAIKNSDLETKRRALMLIDRIEERVLFEEDRTATPVRLRIDDLSVGDALFEVERQIGLPSGNAPVKRRVSVDTGVVPYWQAWRRFCEAAKLQEGDPALSATRLKRIDPAAADDLTALIRSKQIEFRQAWTMPAMNFAVPPSADPYSVDDRHSVRVRVKWHALDRSIDGTQPHAIFAVEVRPEPRLEVVSLLRVEISRIVDSEGRTRAVKTAQMFPETFNGDAAAFLATTPLRVLFSNSFLPRFSR